LLWVATGCRSLRSSTWGHVGPPRRPRGRSRTRGHQPAL